MIGTADDAVAKLKELESIGVDQFDVYLMTEGQHQTLGYGKEIIPRFAGSPRSPPEGLTAPLDD